jgi:hypothetical protein
MGWTWQQWCLLTDKHEDLEQGPAGLLSKHPWIQGIPRICMLSERVIVFVNRGRPVYLSSSSGSQEFSCLHNAANLSVDSEELLILLPRHIVVSSNRLLETIKQGYTWESEAGADGDCWLKVFWLHIVNGFFVHVIKWALFSSGQISVA